MKNIHSKRLIFLAFILPFILCECKKEEKVEPFKIDEIIGTYYGETFFNSGWSLAGGKITKQDHDTLLMDYWRASSGGAIKLFVVGNKLETKGQLFPASGHINYPWKEYYMVYRVSIQGFYRNDSIQYTFVEEIKREGDSVFSYFENGSSYLHRVQE